MQVVITSNSPGEVFTWVKPVAHALNRLGAIVDVVLTPCTFATGQESFVLRKDKNIRHIYPPEDYWKIALGKQKIHREKTGCVLFLGGDIWHARRLGKLLGFPVVMYSTKRADKNLDLIFVPNNKVKEEVAKRVAVEKIQIVGDLMLSSLCMSGLPRKSNKLAFFPGSRDHVKSLLPFFLGTAEKLAKLQPELEFVVSLSPFVENEVLQEALKARSQSLLGVRGRLIEDNCIETDLGLKIPLFRGSQYEIMETSTLAITIPGTNTAEMAFYGLPFVTVLPLNIAREIPLQGIVGLIGNIPYLGPRFKEWLILKKAPSIRFTALPNMLADKEIVPELRGFLTIDELADFVKELYLDKYRLENISKNLLSLYPKNNAANIIAEEIVRRWGDD